jgi:hypothetical protein
MDKFVDRFSQIVASAPSRRDVLKWTSATIMGSVLVSLGIKEAEASGGCRRVNCEACHAEDQCLDGRAGCSCIPRFRAGVARKCFCHDIVSCAGLVSCGNHRDCLDKVGAGWRCSISCCNPTGPGLCHPKCGIGTGITAGGRTSAG